MTITDHDVSLVTLSSEALELTLRFDADYPSIVRWGAPVGGISDERLLSVSQPHNEVDAVRPIPALRDAAHGHLGRPALRVHRNGIGWALRLLTVSKHVERSSVALSLSDPDAGVDVDVRYRLDPAGVLLVDAAVTNRGRTALIVDNMTHWLPLPDRATEVIDFAGRWLKERQLIRRPIEPGLIVREGREGRSGHDYTILQCATTPGTGFRSGEVWAAGLMWSGNTQHLVEMGVTGRRAFGAGERLEPGEVILAPGERYDAPTLVAAHSVNGLDGVSEHYHQWLRSRPDHPTHRGPRPLTINVWEAVYFDHDEERLTELARRASAVGVERFVLDDGWFGARRDDKAGLGDWIVSADAWPNGLGPLVNVVRELGMEFGLWFEGEMVNPDSDLYRQHPDWILRVDGRVPPTSRQQHVLDMVNPEVYAYILDSVSAVVSEFHVDYIKWDHNRALIDAGHEGRAAAHRQTLAIYSLFDELRLRHPWLEIESCASGGGRIDLGMAMHADRFWTSDSNDALERQDIQRHTTIALPPEMLGTHIGPTTSHSSGRTHSLSFRAVTALFGHAGIEWNILEASEEELDTLRTWSAFYREHRALLHGGRTIRLDDVDPSLAAHGVVSMDRSQGLFAIVQQRTLDGSRPGPLRLSGLDPRLNYEISVPDWVTFRAVEHRRPAWMDQPVVASGAWLCEFGITPPILHPEQAILVALRAVEQ